MTEHATDEGFGLRNAMSEIEKAVKYEEPLRQRTEGLTWMIYGLASPAIFLTYHAFYSLVPGPYPTWANWMALVLWVPWIAAASVTSGLLWRSAALTAPAIVEDEPSGWVVTAAWLAAIAVAFGGVFALTYLVSRSVAPSAYFLLWLGAAWAIMGATNVYKSSPTGRRVSTIIGLATALVGLAVALGTTDDDAATVVAMIASGVFPLLGGGWQATRS